MISPAPPAGPPPAGGPAPPAPIPPAPAPPAPAPSAPARLPARTLWALRTAATAHLVTVLGQGVIGGLFVTGEVDLLTWHNVNATAATALVGLQLVAAVVLWRPGRGPAWPLWVSAAQLVLVNGQILLGMERLVGPHIPLAMVIFGVAVWMAAWTWRAGRERA